MRFSFLSLAAAVILPALAAPSARAPPDGCTQDTRFGSVEAVPSTNLNPGDVSGIRSVSLFCIDRKPSGVHRSC